MLHNSPTTNTTPGTNAGSATGAAPQGNGYAFGTISGVFIPSLLTILGTIFFMRANFIVGHMGIMGTVGILALCTSITLATALSIGAISTNTQVRGGGVYFLISRVLGPEFGGSIGLSLFFAQSISITFYVTSFTEVLTFALPGLASYSLHIALVTMAIIFGLLFLGTDWAIKVQYFILATVALSILVSLVSGLVHFLPETVRTNLWPAVAEGAGAAVAGGAGGTAEAAKGFFSSLTFWQAFAIYFPAVTGILTGVNMSGDLKDPGRSIPRGILLGIGVSTLIYFLQIIISGGSYDRALLIDKPFTLMLDDAIFGLGFLIIAGVALATTSSALGSMMTAPKVLQTMSRDGFVGILKPFGYGSPGKDEPRIALLACMAIAVIMQVSVSAKVGGEALNTVAEVITMFFLYAYGMINLAAFTEAFGKNPSFRPRFRFFHWTTALYGTVACLVATLLINPVASIIAFIIIGLLTWHIRAKHMSVAFGDARRGFIFSSIRRQMLTLRSFPEDPRNWRPTMVVFSGNPAARAMLVNYAVQMEAGRGIVMLANILIGDSDNPGMRWKEAVRKLEDFCRTNNLHAFPIVLEAPDLEKGVAAVLQTASMGPIRPNVAVFGWAGAPDRARNLSRELRIAATMGISQVIIVQSNGNTTKSGAYRPHLDYYQPESARGTGKTPAKQKARVRNTIHHRSRVDIWWRGQKNGGLMLLLAHLLTLNSGRWDRAQLRILRLVDDQDQMDNARQELKSLIKNARIDATPLIIHGSTFTPETAYQYSRDASCVFFGFNPPPEGKEEQWFHGLSATLQGLPDAILVSSVGVEDIFA